MADQAAVLEELGKRSQAGALSPRQQEIVQELQRRFGGSQPATDIPPETASAPPEAPPAPVRVPGVPESANTETMQAQPTTFHEGGTLQSETQAKRRDAAAQSQSNVSATRRGILPGVGSIAGMGIGGALGGPPGAAVGEMVGTTAGYGANVALGVEPFDLRSAITQLAPSYALNAWPAARPIVSKLAAGSTVGKTAVNEAGKVIHDAAETAKVGERQTLRDAVTREGQEARQAFDQSEAARVKTRETQIANTQNYNAGVVAQDAAQVNTVESFNAKAQADFAAEEARREARVLRQDLDHQAQVKSWQAVVDQQTKDAEAQKEFVSHYNRQLREETAVDVRQSKVTKAGQVEVIPNQIKTLPNVPTKDEVKDAYKVAQDVATSAGLTLDIPEVRAVQTQLTTRAEALEKIPGGEQLAGTLRRIANVRDGGTGYSLGDIGEALPLLRAHAAALRNSEAEGAATELHAYGKLIDAFEAGIEALGSSHPDVSLWQTAIKVANAKNTKATTVQELSDFATRDWLSMGPDGIAMLDSRKALASLESSANERFRFFMQKTTFDEFGGKSLYDLTKETLTTLAQESLTLAQKADMIAKQGGPVAGRINAPLPMPGKPTFAPKPEPPTPPPLLPKGPYQAPTPQPGQQLTVPGRYQPQSYQAMEPGVPPPYQAVSFQGQDTRPNVANVVMTQGARAAALAGSIGAYTTGVKWPMVAGLGTFAALGPQTLGALMATATGQKTLVRLIQEQGSHLTPQLWGFISAAGRAALQPALGAAPPEGER